MLRSNKPRGHGVISGGDIFLGLGKLFAIITLIAIMAIIIIKGIKNDIPEKNEFTLDPCVGVKIAKKAFCRNCGGNFFVALHDKEGKEVSYHCVQCHTYYLHCPETLFIDGQAQKKMWHEEDNNSDISKVRYQYPKEDK